MSVGLKGRQLKALQKLAVEAGRSAYSDVSSRSDSSRRNAKYWKAKWRLKRGYPEREEEREGVKRKIM